MMETRAGAAQLVCYLRRLKPRNNPYMHDQFIRAILSDKTVAADYFQQYLPAIISHQLDFTTLVHLPDTYLSEELQKTMSDIVYECRKKDGTAAIKVSLLVEHKSYPDKYTPVQIGSYIFSALQKQIANNEALSVVVPVLLYHGRGKWQYQTLAGLFDNLQPEWQPFLPDFTYIYNNLGEVPDADVEALNNHFLRASLLALKHAFEKDWLEQHALRLLILTTDAPEHLHKPFVIYLLGRSELQEAEVMQLFDSLSLDYKNKFMSTLDYFIEKGRKQGIEQGIEQGVTQEAERKNHLFVKNLLLADKFSIAEIAGFANVTEEFVFKVKKIM